MDPIHETFLRHAVRVAVESVARDGGPFGCVIVKDGLVLATGANAVTREHDPTAHAEIVAIRAACRTLGSHQLDGCDLYASCEPCPMCLGAIYWARPRAVYFAASRQDAARAGFDDDLIYRELALVPEQRQRPCHRIPLPDALRPFDDWAARSDRTAY